MIPAGSIIEEIAQDLCDSDIAVDIGDASSPSLSPSDSRVEPNTQTTKASSLDGRDAPPDSFDASCVDGAASDLSQPLFTYIDVDNEDQGKPAHALSGETEHEHTRTNTHDPDADPLTSLGSSRKQQAGSGSSSITPSLQRIVPQLSRAEETPLLFRTNSNISTEVRTLVPLMFTSSGTLTCDFLARGHCKRRSKLHSLVFWKTMERVRYGLSHVLLGLFCLLNACYNS